MQAEELVKHFHQIFHGVEEYAPQSKETAQALTLVSQYGLDRSRHIVHFARAETTKTNFEVQHFGAVLSYAARAVADLDRRRRTRAARPAPAKPREPEKDLTIGQGRLARLTPEQHRARFERTKAVVFGENPFLAGSWKEGSKMHEKMICSRMVRDLQDEPMDLMTAETLTGVLAWIAPTLSNLRADGREHPGMRVS